MRTNQHDCSDEFLLPILTQEESLGDAETILEQIEGCPKCRRRLEELAAEQGLWTRAQSVLSSFDGSTRSFRTKYSSEKRTSSNAEEGFDAGHRNWNESMASQLLGPASHPEMLGRIGRYEVERLIGSGGMGIVFKAIDTELNRPVAIKLLAPYLAGNGAARQRFLREAKAAAAVVHEHVVPIYNVESDSDSPFLVMHYIAGESLQARIDREGSLELCEILRIGMQVASGLEAAHLQGLVHRDIKPSNILLEQGVERSLITDFGLARSADDASLTNTGYHAGTPQYMSPEQAKGDDVDFRSDLFSLGSVLYTMSAGRAPFRAETAYGILRKIIDTDPRSLQEINSRIPAWLEQLIDKLMSKEPAQRFASAAEVSSLLEECLAHVQSPTNHALPASLATPKTTPKRIHTILVAAIFCAIIVGAWLSVSNFGSLMFNQQRMSSNSANVLTKEKNSRDTESASKTEITIPKKERRIAKSLQLAPDPADDIRQKLLMPLDQQTAEFSLEELVQAIEDTSDIAIDINRESLGDASFDPTTKVRTFEGESSRSLLQRACSRMGLAYIVHESNIEIASKEYAAVHPVLRHYDLAYLMSDSKELGTLVRTIESCIEPDSWKQNGGGSAISVIEAVLMVNAPESTHVELEKLLYKSMIRSN